MKKVIILCSCLFISMNANSQQFFMEIFSGYNIVDYDHPAYETEDYSDAGHSPIGLRIAAGHEYAQLGFEYRQNLTNPEFDLAKGSDFITSLEETYYGGFLRINISSLPVYRTGLILKGGAGYYIYSQDFEALGTKVTYEHDKKLGFHGGIGVSGPIYANLHFELGYSYHFIERDPIDGEIFAGAAPPPGAEGYNGNYHSIQFGLSINLMVTAKGKAGCQNKRHRSKGKHGRGGWFSN